MRGIILFLIIAISLVLISGCTVEKSIRLDDSNIRNYEGENIFEDDGFRENSIKGPQYINISDYSLEVTGLVEKNLSLSYDTLLENDKYSKLVTIDCVEGWSVTVLWEGILVRDILQQAGPLDEANTIIFYAEDGYSTSFPLEYIMENDIIMAYKMDGNTLRPERGYPFQLVAEEKWGYKWIKWITSIELSDDESYRGYWEKRGYSNTGNLDESFLE